MNELNMIESYRKYEIHLNTSAELLNELSKLHNSNDIWYFRGQPANYLAVPSLFRDAISNRILNEFDEILRLLGYSDVINSNVNEIIFPYFLKKIIKKFKGRSFREDLISNHIKYSMVEQLLPFEFLKKTNFSGLEIEFMVKKLQFLEEIKLSGTAKKLYDSMFSSSSLLDIGMVPEEILMFFRNYILRADTLFKANYINGLNTVMPLAQHHHIPTRFLDFTTNPFVASYFAAENEKEEECLVYAIKDNIINKFFPNLGVLSIVNPREFVNLHKHINLFRQQGVFLLIDSLDVNYLMKGFWPSIECFINKSGFSFELDSEMVFKKFILPHACKNELLKILDKQGINKVFLMPTYDNAGLVVKKILNY